MTAAATAVEVMAAKASSRLGEKEQQQQHNYREPIATVRSYDVKHGFLQDAAQSTIVAVSIAELVNAMLLL